MFFRLPWFSKSKPASFRDTQVLDFDYLIDEFQAAMADIKDERMSRLHADLLHAQSPKDLWFLRGKLFNLISRHHCESEAFRRVARLDEKLQFFVEHHPDYSADELPSKPMALVH